MKITILKRDFVRLWQKMITKPIYWIITLLIISLSFFSSEKLISPVTKDITVIAKEEFIVQADFNLFPLLVKEGKENFPSDISSKAVMIRERESNQIIYEYNVHERMAPASLTKMMTALVVIDKCALEEEVVASDVPKEGSLMGLENGERVTVSNLLYGMLVQSGNDAATLLGNHCFGNIENTVKKMNEIVTFLQLKDTHFVDVTGLSEKDHYSSAFDLISIAELLLRNEVLKEIVGTSEITISSLDRNRWYSLKSTNDFLFENLNIYGVKTGYTELAGECLIIAYKTSNRDFLIVLLGSSDRFGDAEKIIQYLESTY